MGKLPGLLAAALLFYVQGSAQGYSNGARQQERLQALSRTFGKYVQLGSVGKSAGGADIWMMSIGSGNRHGKPAIAVIGGVEGPHLLGTELAIGFAETLLGRTSADSLEKILSKTTFYIFPNVSPDAMQQAFAPLKQERWGNASATDDDRDGSVNEDPAEDLDKDGQITMMRVLSPVGTYRLHPDDARVMVKADVSKGERGAYQLYTEGVDNDRDDTWNEDGEGGIAFNRNLTYRHPTFKPGAGEFPVSEKETRAVLDTLYELFNVYAVVSFSSLNNLSTPFAYVPQQADQRIPAGWLEADARVNALVSTLYNKWIPPTDAPKTNPAGGDLLSWAYFHYGRFSFSTPGWWVPKPKPDTTKKEKPLSVDDPAAHYLRWCMQQGHKPAFTEWKGINHPDFPGQTVEVGGLWPGALWNPPYSLVDELVRKHTQWLIQLGESQAKLEIRNIRTEKLGNGLTRVSVDVMNTGLLPTHTRLGERSYWVKRLQVQALPGKGQQVAGGNARNMLPSLEGGGSRTYTWLVRGSGTFRVEAGSAHSGIVTQDINL